MIGHVDIRRRTEEAEENLSSCASRSRFSRGRANREEACRIRTAFQRDRDRIIHSNAFRRLKHKTQVFLAPLDDHYVTRLTHTVEVAQIARTISRALSLNEDLTEAIALGHDLGHTPFGHVGEEVLNDLCSTGFRHNEQSLRVVDSLEKRGHGLNLTWEVRDGILNHSKGQIGILGEGWTEVGTIEGQVVKMADIVAYVNHDVADAIRAAVITENELPESVLAVLGRSSSERINTLVCDIVDYSAPSISGLGPGERVIGVSPEVLEAADGLREFLFDRVYNPNLISEETEKAREAVRVVYSYFLKHEDKLPEEYTSPEDKAERRVADYVAGMTDQYALRMAEEVSR